MSASRLVRLSIAVAALCVAASAGIVSTHRARGQLTAIEACEAVRVGDFATALALSEGRTGASETGRKTAECRCMALFASGAGPACVELLEGLLDDPRLADWAPQPALSVHLIQTWRDAARTRDAALLAQRAGRLYPDDADVFHLELETRASVEDEEAVLRELEERIPPRGDAAARMRVSLAQRHLRRSDPVASLSALGEQPPAAALDARGLWFDTFGVTHAMQGDLTGTRRSYDAWERAGGDPVEVGARYALALSIAGLAEPGRRPVDLLRGALLAGDELDPKLHEALVIRLILTLVNAGRLDEAMAAHDHHRNRFALEGLQRRELERAVRHRALQRVPAEERRGELRFRVEDAPDGSALWLSPEPDAPVDQGYERIEVPPSGSVAATRTAGVAPQRYVLRAADERVLASGTLSPLPGEALDVVVRARDVEPTGTPTESAPRAPADGRIRVVLLVLDCADWRIVQYLRARRELPVLDSLIADGYRAVLDSDPPLTAAALEALVWPQRRGGSSVVGVVHRFGVELAGLASVGTNPFSALSWVLPESEDIFAVLGSGRHRVANLLLAHGGIRAGRHGEVTGPGGRKRHVPLGSTARDLDALERARWPALAQPGSERDAFYVRTIAAELDAATLLARGGQVDLVAVRVEPLDILTHAHFAEIVVDGQDDGRGLLFSTYRYIDARIAGVRDALDGDDVLIVMSDHGIRTAMEHSRHSLFVASGPRVPQGRAPGWPALRGVSRAVADLLGVATSWPDTGVLPSARAIATAPTSEPAAAPASIPGA
jgi:hypothetical protein